MEQRVSVERLEQAVNLFGSFDENIRLLEREFSVTVVNRDGELRVSGEAENVMMACKAVEGLLSLSARGETIGEQNVRYVCSLVRAGKGDKIAEMSGNVLCVSAKGRPVKPKTLGQEAYIRSVLKNTVTIGVGPAGTGKNEGSAAGRFHPGAFPLRPDRLDVGRQRVLPIHAPHLAFLAR